MQQEIDGQVQKIISTLKFMVENAVSNEPPKYGKDYNDYLRMVLRGGMDRSDREDQKNNAGENKNTKG